MDDNFGINTVGDSSGSTVFGSEDTFGEGGAHQTQFDEDFRQPAGAPVERSDAPIPDGLMSFQEAYSNPVQSHIADFSAHQDSEIPPTQAPTSTPASASAPTPTSAPTPVSAQASAQTSIPTPTPTPISTPTQASATTLAPTLTPTLAPTPARLRGWLKSRSKPRPHLKRSRKRRQRRCRKWQTGSAAQT